MVAVRMRTAGQQALRRNNHHDGPGIIMPGAAACAFDTGALQPAVPLHEGDVLRRSPSLPCFFIPVFQTLARPVVPGAQALSAWLCAISIQFLRAACAARMRGVSAHALRCAALPASLPMRARHRYVTFLAWILLTITPLLA